MRLLVVFAVPLAAIACGDGDNAAARAFHPTVKVGSPLTQVIMDGEKAQLADIEYSVRSGECPGQSIDLRRHNSGPSVRVWDIPVSPDQSWERGYHETGYPNRAAFAAALPDQLSPFLKCKEFVFTFGRYQGWPTSDSFTVQIDATGTVTGVSPLTKNEMD